MKTVMELYRAIEAKGKLLEGNGLCNDVSLHLDNHDCVDYALNDTEGGNFTKMLDLFHPVDEHGWRDEHGVHLYWGYTGEGKLFDPITDEHFEEFTPLRQTLLLFLAAINGEL